MSTRQQEIDLVDGLRATMLAKLRANAHKGTWGDESLGWLLERLREEVDELDRVEGERALNGERGTVHREALRQSVIDECADVANFAAMIADNVRRAP